MISKDLVARHMNKLEIGHKTVLDEILAAQ